VVLDEAVTEAAAFTQVNVRATLRACSTTDSIKLYRKGFCPERCVPEIPNVITPNGDGLNDVLRVRMTCNTQDLQLFIYNRWGQLVHRSEGYTTQWDGSIAGSPASDGTYYYVLEFTDERGEGKSYRGTLNVLTE
jgi:gliding motility-associated-like protein